MTSPSESVSRWIIQLQTGEAVAIEKVWNRYYRRLIRYASRKLRGPVRRTVDEEDVVSQAFNSFFRRIGAGHFPHVRDRDELWKLLVKITQRKALTQIRAARRLKRGGDQTPIGCDALLEQSPGRDPRPDLAAMMNEWHEQRMNALGDGLGEILELRLQGYTNVEIAARIKRSVPTVERRLRLIRQILQREFEHE